MMVRNGMPCSVALLLTSLCVQSWALATTAPAAVVVVQPDPCRATVLRFERALSIMRETQGNKAGEELKEKLLPAKLQSEILLKEGYCGLARYIQEKKLDR